MRGRPPVTPSIAQASSETRLGNSKRGCERTGSSNRQQKRIVVHFETEPVGGRLVNGAKEHIPLGDRDALGQLFERHEPRLLAVAHRFTRDRDSARDIVQNAYLKVLRHGADFRGGAKIGTWMHRIVANEALMWLRSERRRRLRWITVENLEAMAPADPAPSVARRVDAKAECERVMQALESLPERDRRIAEDCFVDGNSYADWGRANGVHPAAVKSRAFRARQRLRAAGAREPSEERS